MTALPYPAGNPARTLLAVPGMHCAGCMSKIERGLGETAGIRAARVNLSTRTVTVDHEEQIDAHDLVQALAGLGFEEIGRAHV